nr:FtsW/RodA/SpoVE family cell cycle protein [Neobacillus sp. Marseille-Q6967]
MTNKKRIFLKEVLNQIKSKEAKKFVSDELSHHLQEAKKGWQEKGLSEVEAEKKAIEGMGSPVKLGIQLNKLHRPKVDWWIISLLGMALLVGFLPLFSLGYLESKYFVFTKVTFVLLGTMVAVGLMLVDYRKWQNRGWIFYTAGVLLLLTIRFLSNRMINGVPRIEIGPLTIETLMAVPFFWLAWAGFFNDEKFKVWQFIGLFLVPLFLFLSIPGMATAYVYTIMVFGMLGWSKFSRKIVITIYSVITVSMVVFGILALKFSDPYQLQRLLAFLKPEDYSNGAGYTILRIKEFLLNAGWFGVSGAKQFIPEAHTNFVFVTFTYYYGWLFAIVLVALLSLFAARIIFVMFQIKNSFGKRLLIGAVALYLAQLGTNVLMSLGVFPLVGVSLPFLSYGLMPTLLNAILMGVVLSVYRRKAF